MSQLIWTDMPLPETRGQGVAARCAVCGDFSGLRLDGDTFVCRDANKCHNRLLDRGLL